MIFPLLYILVLKLNAKQQVMFYGKEKRKDLATNCIFSLVIYEFS